MPKITQIQHDNKTQRVIIYVDYRYCASIKPNIWKEMNLSEGTEISCAKLHQKEIMVWRRSKKKDVIYSDKLAINRTAQWFNKFIPSLEVKVIDFGSGHEDSGLSNNLFLNYPNTRNDQNISLFIKGTDKEVITLEIASTGIRRGANYWVRSDKLRYAQIQTKRDGWIALYCKHPTESLVWIKPVSGKKYISEELIRRSGSRFVAFNDKSPEIYSSKRFCEYIKSRIDSISSSSGSSTAFDTDSGTNSNKSSKKLDTGSLLFLSQNDNP